MLLNPAPFYPVPQELLPMVDFLVLNETEATALTGMHILNVETAKQAARILYNYGRRTVIVTLGSTGAVLVNDEGLIFQPAFEVNAVDTTAAGDTFVGSFASSMLEGKSAAESLLFAAAASAISVTRLGAQASIPTRAEVESFLNSHRQSESSPPL